MNVRDYVSLITNTKILLPLVLIVLYLLGYSFLNTYKKQKQRILNS